MTPSFPATPKTPVAATTSALIATPPLPPTATKAPDTQTILTLTNAKIPLTKKTASTNPLF